MNKNSGILFISSILVYSNVLSYAASDPGPVAMDCGYKRIEAQKALDSGDLSLAETLFKESIKCNSEHTSDAYQQSCSYFGLLQTYEKANRNKEALAVIVEYLPLVVASEGATSPRAVLVLDHKIKLLQLLGRYEEANETKEFRTKIKETMSMPSMSSDQVIAMQEYKRRVKQMLVSAWNDKPFSCDCIAHVVIGRDGSVITAELASANRNSLCASEFLNSVRLFKYPPIPAQISSNEVKLLVTSKL